ncbi:DNA endonuclease SmrA [Gallaecimonas sp. GXIMD4217]|uniref:DNA endonuclease SmrA n=1 Tax=Gallaecimonas sp. GXIMD4217 TaxID=3131927 RepID=UPI00311B115F
MMQDDDKFLFEKEMAGVKRIRQEDRAERRPERQDPAALKARRAAAEAELVEDANFLSSEAMELVEPRDVLSYKKDGVQDGVFKQLRQGRYEVQSVLDLHRLRFVEARQQVFQFIQDAHKAGLRTLLILHGRGENSRPPALLKSCCAKWLKELPPVLAYHSAQRNHGGTGALYVLLRKNALQKQDNFERHAKRTGR